MARILFIVGTRPEAIKIAPVVTAAAARGMEATVCATAQHRGMLDQALGVFGIKPDMDLDLMQPGQDLGELTARLFAALPRAIADAAPDAVLVQGDTTTAFAGALCAFYARVPVGHVEAGLRTGDPLAPFPEEINRRLVAQVARWHFAPTERARANLLREGVNPGAIRVTGNTVVDALQWMAARAPEPPPDLLPPPGSRLVLVTGHRRESFGEGMRSVCRALADLADRNPGILVVYPVHPNPNVAGPVRQILGDRPNVRLTDPVDYPVLVGLMRRSVLVITDSGGIQEEAPSLGVPVLVTREVTERPEAVEADFAQLVGTDHARIVEAAEAVLTAAGQPAAGAPRANPFGDGKAAGRIIELLSGEFP
jgi:UDP-N-acetylglucosamine 2-epimerase